MTTQKLSEREPIQPVKLTMVGTGDGGGTPIRSGMVAQTPGVNTPNVIVTVVKPIVAIGIRFAHNYLTILMGLLAAGLSTDVIPYTDFFELATKCAGLSVAGAMVGFGKDLITIFGRLENSWPLLSGNV